jgi:hypothetical protein
LALGRATLDSVTLLKAPLWYHWEAQAHSEDPKRAAIVEKQWYLWKFVNAEPFQYPQVCPKFQQAKYMTAQQRAAQATPEDTQDSQELENARDAAAQAISALVSPWAGPGPGVSLPTPGKTPVPDQPGNTRQDRQKKIKDKKEEHQGAGKGQKVHTDKHAGRKRKAETPDQEGISTGSLSGKVPRQGEPGPGVEAAEQGKEGTITSSSAHLAASQQPVTDAGEGGLPAPCHPPLAGAKPSRESLGPSPARSGTSWLLPDVLLSQHASQVFELLRALDPIKHWLQPMDLLSFVRLHPRTKDDLALQVMVAMVKHPLFAEDLVDHALKNQEGESHTDRLARATRKAMELHSERLQRGDAATLQCHATLDYHISSETGIAPWCQRLNLVSKVASPSQGDADSLILGPAGKPYFLTGDTQRLQALVPRSGATGMHGGSHGSNTQVRGVARAQQQHLPACQHTELAHLPCQGGRLRSHLPPRT